MKRILIFKRMMFVPLLLIISFIAISCSSTASHSQINVDADGVALKGYDPVAYFTMGKPIKGEKQFEHDWNEAKWLFASQEHKDLFAASPEKYAPQYGGY